MHLEQIARTGFLVSLTSYIFFWILDLARPGFVARFFSVHIFLLGIIVFGIWWSHAVDAYTDHFGLQKIIAIVCSVFLTVLVWSLTDVFGFWRGVLSFLAFFIPLLVLRLIRFR